jgi:hypothetical protein
MPTPDVPRTSRAPLWVALFAVGVPLVLLAVGLVWWQGGIGIIVGREQCVATSRVGSVELEPEQAEHAATIAATAVRRQLPTRAVTVGLATAMQESQLRNLDGGDHDSAGLFQQRPSQGWGTFDQVTDPDYASNRFFDALMGIDGWQTLAITEAAQAVQRSAFPDAYQQHADEARILADTFTGRAGAALTCTVRAESERKQSETATGLTGRAQHVREEMESAFGTLSLGGFAPGGVTRANPSAHNDGRAIDVFFRPHRDSDQRRSGWRLANWLVAHADRLDIALLIYRDQIWSARRSPEGWRGYVSSFGDPKDPVQRHLDHIHVEVV